MTALGVQSVLESRAQVEAFQRKHRIGVLTLLFTDIVGSTRIKQTLGDADGFARIQEHHAAVRELLKVYPEGEEISTAGDSCFLVFAKPSEAVKFALHLQSRLRAMAQSGAAVFDRIGIHVGEVIIEERPGAPKPRDLYGMQVDICGRLMSAGDGDQILLTRSAFDNARQVLRGKTVDGLRDLVWLNHGPYQLSGVEEPLDICEVGEEGVARLRPPTDSEKVRRYVSADSAVAQAASVADRAPAASPGRGWVAMSGIALVGVLVIAGLFMMRRDTPVTPIAPAIPAAPTAAPAPAPREPFVRFGFERAEGYTPGQSLIGQQGWVRGNWPGQLDTGGQGIGTNLFGSRGDVGGHQAFLGGVAGETKAGIHAALQRPLKSPPGVPGIEIAWKQLIKASSDGVNNSFNWLFYDQAGRFLCGLHFDNATRSVAGRLADNSYARTSIKFKNDQVIDVKLWFDFRQNQWSASIGPDALPVRSLTNDGREANLGSFAVTWRSFPVNAITPGGPVAGDNLLAFDELVFTVIPRQ